LPKSNLGEGDVARNIGIVGAGIAGLHLALYLQKAAGGRDHHHRSRAGGLPDSRLLNTVAITT
jgi:predicted NAD/FAD-binding protein